MTLKSCLRGNFEISFNRFGDLYDAILNRYFNCWVSTCSDFYYDGICWKMSGLHISFNPCFGGSILWHYLIIMYYNREEFQLCFGDLILWLHFLHIINPSVFQPCLVDLILRRENSMLSERLLFQSCLVDLYYDVTLPTPWDITKGFNLVLVDSYYDFGYLYHKMIFCCLILVWWFILWHMNWATENNHLHLFQLVYGSYIMTWANMCSLGKTSFNLVLVILYYDL